MAEPVEKQVSESSSNDGLSISSRDAIAADQEKAVLGQAPFPTQLPIEPAPPLERLDSRVPRSEKELEDQDPYAHLPEHEATILRRQVDIPPVKVTYFMLYRYATRNDILIMIFSGFCAIAGGAVMPLMTIIFGTLAGTFQGFFNGTGDPSSFQGTINHLVLYFVYLAVAEFVTIYIATV